MRRLSSWLAFGLVLVGLFSFAQASTLSPAPFTSPLVQYVMGMAKRGKERPAGVDGP